ncbi:hypothetical protein V7799_10100 [Rhizobium laguerreae]
MGFTALFAAENTLCSVGSFRLLQSCRTSSVPIVPDEAQPKSPGHPVPHPGRNFAAFGNDSAEFIKLMGATFTRRFAKDLVFL